MTIEEKLEQENAVAAQSNARAEDFGAWAYKAGYDFSIGEDRVRCAHAHAGWRARQPEIDALKSQIDYLDAACKEQQARIREQDEQEQILLQMYAELKRENKALLVESYEVQNMLGRALGHGQGIIVGDCREIGGTDDDVFVGQHTLVTLAMLAAERIKLRNEDARIKELEGEPK